MMTGQAGALLVPWLGWQALFALGAVPGVIVAIMVLGLHESPRWSISHGRLDQAEAAIVAAEASASRRFPDFRPLSDRELEQAASAIDGPTLTSKSAPWRALVSATFRSRTLVTWILWFTAFFVANGLNNWMPTLYHTVYDLPLQTALRAASLTNVAQVLVLLGCAFLIDRIGRRQWAIGAFLLSAALLGALALSGATSVTLVIVVATIAYGVVGSNNAVLYLYTPEIYPTRMRAIGTGLATSWLRVASAVGPTLVGMMVAQHGVQYAFAMFAGVAVVGALAAMMMIETRSRRLEDIAA
jgi:putative MFS transporter